MSDNSNNIKSRKIPIAITFGVPILIALLPTGEVFTWNMKMAIALTFWMLSYSAFELSSLAVCAVLWAALMILLNVVPATTIFGPWLSITMYGAMGCFLLSNILNECGLLKRVAYKVAIMCGGSYNKSVYAIFFATFAVSILTFCSGSVVCAALTYGFVAAMGLQKKKEGAILMIAGMLGGSTVRMFLYYPVTMGPLVSSVQTVEPNFSINFAQLFINNWPVFFFCLGFIWLMEFVAKTKNSDVNGSVEYFKEEYAALGTMSKKEKKGLIGVLVILIWIITAPIHHIDGMYAFAIVAFALCMPGIEVGSGQCIQNISWSTMLFFASCLAIGGVCATTGIVAAVGNIAAPILSDFGPVATLIAVLIFGVLANFCMTPVAMLAGFSGMLYTIALNLGMDPLALIFTFNMSTDMVFLPYEYLTFLVFFAFGGMTMKQFFTYHAAKDLVYMLFFIAIIIPYWFLIGLI